MTAGSSFSAAVRGPEGHRLEHMPRFNYHDIQDSPDAVRRIFVSGRREHNFHSTGVCMIDREKIKDVLENQIRPSLQSHGGDCELVEITEDGVVRVVLQGACRGCPMAQMTIQQGVQARLQEAVPGVREVVAVEPRESEG